MLGRRKRRQRVPRHGAHDDVAHEKGCKAMTQQLTEEQKARKSAYNAAYRQQNKERLAAHQKAYREEHKETISKREAIYREAHKEKRALLNSAWHAANYDSVKFRKRATATAWRLANPDRRQEYAIRARERNPEKHAGRQLVNLEVRYGRFPPPNAMVCRMCGEAQAQEYHHHNGYGPGHEIDVIAVCRECHTAAHRKGERTA